LQKDVENARFEGDKMMGIDGVGAHDGEDGCSENSEDGEKIDPGGRTSFYGNFLMDGIKGRAANTFGIQDFQPARG
jgi:hypothetical protein